MPHIYLAPWSVYRPIEGKPAYGPAILDGLMGSLDLRSNTLCSRIDEAQPGYGLLTYEAVTNLTEATYLGWDPQEPLSLGQRNALANAVGRAIPATSLQEVLRDLFLNPSKYDATGVDFHKPLRGGRRSGVKLCLGGYGALIDEAYSEGHQVLQATLAVRWADYRRNRAYAEALPGESRSAYIEALKRNTGYDMLKLFGRVGDDLLPGLLPPEYLADGWSAPQTIITEGWPSADNAALSDDLTWTEFDAGDWQRASNRADRITTTGDKSARADSDLSSDDHYSQALCYWGSTGQRIGVAVRFSSSAQTYYAGTVAGSSGNRNLIDKMVAGTRTNLISDNSTPDGVSGDTIYLEVDGSDLDLRHNSTSKATVTDTAITGNVRCGLFDRTGNQWDDFEAGDLAVGGFASSQAVIIS